MAYRKTAIAYRSEAKPVDISGEKAWEEKQIEMKAKTEHDEPVIGNKDPWKAYIYWMWRSGVNASITARGDSPSEAVEKLYVEWSQMKGEGWTQEK